MYVCMYVYIHTYMCVCMYIYTHIHIHTYIYNRLIMIYPLLSPLWLVNRLTIWGFLYWWGIPIAGWFTMETVSRGSQGVNSAFGCAGDFPAIQAKKPWENHG